MNDFLEEKYIKLQEILRNYGRLAIAFSGGVDSSFLVVVAKRTLGRDFLAIFMDIHSVPLLEKEEAEEFCERFEIPRIVLKYDELSIPGFAENPPDRCYICKKSLFTEIMKRAKEEGFDIVAEGSNADDVGDYRPGMKALSELGVKSPLTEAGLTKEEIRILSKELGLPTWDKPSKACLSSRFVYGERITEEKLRMVEIAEVYLQTLGIEQLRVRIHGENLARIEVEQKDFEIVLENKKKIISEFKKIGFLYVTLDLKGFRSGSMNEVLKK